MINVWTVLFMEALKICRRLIIEGERQKTDNGIKVPWRQEQWIYKFLHNDSPNWVATFPSSYLDIVKEGCGCSEEDSKDICQGAIKGTGAMNYELCKVQYSIHLRKLTCGNLFPVQKKTTVQCCTCTSVQFCIRTHVKLLVWRLLILSVF